MKKNLSVLIVDDDMIPITLSVIRCLGIQGNIDIHVLSFVDITFPIFRFSRYIKTFTNIKVSNDNETFLAIHETIKKVNANVIFPIRERTSKIIAERKVECLTFACLPLIPEPSILDIAGNKWLLYNWLYENNLSTVKPIRYLDFLNNDKKLDGFSYPLLIKPFNEAGGVGIEFLRDEQELLDYQPNQHFKSDDLLIQPYIPGYDIDFSALVSNGTILAYTIQRGLDKKREFVYSRHIEFVHNEELYNHASLILKNLDYSGIAHLDFRFNTNDNSYNLVDFNARFWRSMMGSLCAGINFPWLALQKAVGNDFPLPNYRDLKYIAEVNPFKVVSAGISIRNSDIRFDTSDPLPYIAGIGYHLTYLIRRKIISLKR